MRQDASRGFTLIELILTVALLSIMAVISINVITDTSSEDAFSITVARMEKLREALVGDTALKVGNTRKSFGYLGDVGALPTAGQGLAALTTNPGVPVGGWSMSASERTGAGWNGPYLPQGDPAENYTQDAWGTTFTYNPTATPPTIVSLGADRAAGGTGMNRDITLQIPLNLVRTRVHGFILNSGSQVSETAEVEINYPNGSGALTTATKTLAAGDNGYFYFDNIPPGERSATVYLPPRPDPTQTIGPVIFTVDVPNAVIPTDLLDKTNTTPTTPKPDLVVPIELVDYPVSSKNGGSSTDYDRTTIGVDTGDYDGTLTYSLEIMASNTDTSTRRVSVLNSSATESATIDVPASTATPTRMTATFTPVTGAATYKIRLKNTSSDNQLIVYEARLLIKQVNATKSKIYIPLVAYTYNSFSNSGSTALDSILSGSSPGQGNLGRNYALWYKDASAWGSIASGTPYTLDVVLSAETGGTTATAALYTAAGVAVTGATASVVGVTVTRATASFADSAMADLTSFQLKLSSSSSSKSSFLHRAGLWLALSSLDKGEVYYRTGLAVPAATGAANVDLQRASIDLDSFSTPSLFHEITGWAATGSASVDLMDAGTSDSGTSGSALGSSNLALPATTKGRLRSSALTLTSANRVWERLNYSSGTANLVQSLTVVKFANE